MNFRIFELNSIYDMQLNEVLMYSLAHLFPCFEFVNALLISMNIQLKQ